MAVYLYEKYAISISKFSGYQQKYQQFEGAGLLALDSALRFDHTPVHAARKSKTNTATFLNIQKTADASIDWAELNQP